MQAPSGQLLPINVLHPPSPADVYRCIGCTKPECQVLDCCPFQMGMHPRVRLRHWLFSTRSNVAAQQPRGLVAIAAWASCAARLRSLRRTWHSPRQQTCAIARHTTDEDMQGLWAARPQPMLLYCPRCAPRQGPSGCASTEMAWRREGDGYLKQILTAKASRRALRCCLAVGWRVQVLGPASHGVALCRSAASAGFSASCQLCWRPCVAPGCRCTASRRRRPCRRPGC